MGQRESQRKVNWWKRKIAEVIKNLKQGDTILVSELSRLGRSMLECMEILSIAFEKEINIYAVKGNWQLAGLFSFLFRIGRISK